MKFQSTIGVLIVITLMCCNNCIFAGRIKREETCSKRAANHTIELNNAMLTANLTDTPGKVLLQKATPDQLETPKVLTGFHATETVNKDGSFTITNSTGTVMNGTTVGLTTNPKGDVGIFTAITSTVINKTVSNTIAPNNHPAHLDHDHVAESRQQRHGAKTHETKFFKHHPKISFGEGIALTGTGKTSEPKHVRLRSHMKKSKHGKMSGSGTDDDTIVVDEINRKIEIENEHDDNTMSTLMRRMQDVDEKGGMILMPRNSVIETCVRELPYETDHPGNGVEIILQGTGIGTGNNNGAYGHTNTFAAGFGTAGNGVTSIASQYAGNPFMPPMPVTEISDYPLMNLLKFTHLLIGKIDAQLRQLPVNSEDPEGSYHVELQQTKPKLLNFLQNVHEAGIHPKEEWDHWKNNDKTALAQSPSYNDDQELEIRCPIHHYGGPGEAGADIVKYCTCHLIRK